MHIQRDDYVHTEKTTTMYVHTIVERWIMYIQERLWQCTLRSGVTDYANFFNHIR
jgi:hypothetical protein